MGGRFAWICLLVLAFPWVEVRAASAEARPTGADSTPLPIGFEWERRPGAESCPDTDALLRATETVLERNPFVRREQAHVFIRGNVAPTPDRRAYQVRLELVAGDGSIVGERRLRSEGLDCATLIDPLTLVIGLAIDTLRTMPRASLHIPKPPAKTEPWRFEVAPEAAAIWGLLPSPEVGIGVDARLEPPSFFPIDASIVSWFVPNRDRIDGGVGGDFTALAFRLALCPPVIDGPAAELRICMGPSAARVAATGVGLEFSQSRASWLWGVGARATLTLPLASWFAVEPSVGVMVPFVRDRFTYLDANQQVQLVHRPSQIMFMLEFAAPVRIF